MILEPNPILKREMRARWRGRREYILVFCWLCLVCAGVTLGYSQAVESANAMDVEDLHALAVVGHQVFSKMAFAQMLLWIVLSTMMSAGAIARERELGLLESLQLSPVHAVRIVAGKFWSILAFMLLAQLTLAPLQTIGFMLGGVAPGELVQCGVLQLMATITCIAIGLCCSAWCRRPGAAVILACIAVVLWLAPTDVFHEYVGSPGLEVMNSIPGPYMFYRMFDDSNSLLERSTGQSLVLPLLQGNPFNATLEVVTPRSAPTAGYNINTAYRYGSYGGGRYPPAMSPFSGTSGAGPTMFLTGPLPIWLSALICQLMITMAALSLAWRGTRRLWSDTPAPVERRRFLTLQVAHAANQPRLRLAATVMDEDGVPDTPAATQGWWNVPLLSLIRSRNPILQREMRQRLQLPKPRSAAKARGMWALRVALLVAYALWMLKITFMGIYVTAWPPVAPIMLLVMVIAAYIGARGFSKEHEAGTWESIVLSRMPAYQVIWGKLLPVVLISALYFSVLLVPPVLLRSSTIWNFSGLPRYLDRAWLIAICALALAAAWGLLVSWFCRRSTAAVGWTLGTMAAWFIAVPVLWAYVATQLTPVTSSYGYDEPNPAMFDPLLAVNPLAAIGQLEEMAERGDNQYYPASWSRVKTPHDLTLLACTGLMAQTAVILVALYFVMRRHHGREPNRRLLLRT